MSEPIEGAEEIRVPAFTGIIEALEWIRQQPEEVRREINRDMILRGLRESFEAKLKGMVDELFAGLPR